MKSTIGFILIVSSTFLFNFIISNAQEAQPFIGDYDTFSVLVNIFQPSGAVYFEVATDKPNELDLFRDGGTSFDVRLFGLEAQQAITGKNATTGMHFGFGIGKSTPDPANAIREAGIFVWGGSLFLKAGQTASIEAGWIQGVSAQEGLTKKGRTDAAWFIGINFQTAFTEKLNTLMSKL